jgi:uncharacterized protein
MKQCWLSAVALLALLATAQSQPAPNAQASANAAAGLEWGPGLKVLIVGGGWAHDFDTWFNKADTATLHQAGITNNHYTEDPAVAARELSRADVLVLSANSQEFQTPQIHQALSNYVDSGKGVVLLHASLWYNWKWNPTNFDEFGSELVGGGARDHDGEAPFDETVIKDHPVTHDLPATFKATEELYHTAAMPGASPMEVLIEASRPGGQKYPSVWLVHYRDARIVCIALGHDGNAHHSPQYQKLLVNAVNWAGQK